MVSWEKLPQLSGGPGGVGSDGTDPDPGAVLYVYRRAGAAAQLGEHSDLFSGSGKTAAAIKFLAKIIENVPVPLETLS